ncbi:competence protein ComEA [Thermostaphylospora chromogena]|uniref:Competence protein ComEA n=1 Tax=Thermostaphylospora chromogena TaxID=35622 RepID=A0A1H1FN17_9ACTN|nr:competence protein ComEA [Thermostaphylospora chromogena]
MPGVRSSETPVERVAAEARVRALMDRSRPGAPVPAYRPPYHDQPPAGRDPRSDREPRRDLRSEPPRAGSAREPFDAHGPAAEEAESEGRLDDRAPFSGLAPGGWREALADRAAMFELPPPGLRLLLLIALVAALVGGYYAWRSRPAAEPVSPPPAASPPSPPPAPESSASPPAPEVTVHVTGKVRKPGVVTLPGGSRVTDAIEAAGGVKGKARTGSLNLARRLVDGEQIVVGGPGGGAVAAPPDAAAASGPGLGPEAIDLNTATVEQLDTLPGVGEVLARRIVDYRTTHGGFRDVAQLREVPGIGEARYAELRDRVRVG